MIHTQDADFTLYLGDVLEQLALLPDESVHCVVTSPPYWGLRDYGTGEWTGGDADCDHTVEASQLKKRRDVGRAQTGTFNGSQQEHDALDAPQFRDVCGKCGARRADQQLGLEPTPELYVARMVEVFREVRRVLRADGTCWVNLGDSYAAQGGGKAEGQYEEKRVAGATYQFPRTPPPGLKPKDLCGIPWRVAFALQADGWYLRSDIIWAKPNPMPESVTDRPTKSHEYVFLLTKSPRYFFDQEAVRESASWARWGDQTTPKHADSDNGAWMKPKSKAELEAKAETGRNVRTVWDIATQPYPEAHFATYPEELVRRCVLAGSSERGCCPVCGRPWEREVERGESDYARLKREEGHDWTDMDAAGLERGVIIKEGEGGQTRKANGTVPSLTAASVTTLDWRPGCDHDAQPVPCTVLDPFSGSGTTNFVARKHGRRSIGIELNSSYADLAARRMAQQSLEFAL